MWQDDAVKDFPDDAEEGNATVVIAVSAVTFILIEGDNVGISYVPGDVALLPAQARELVEVPQHNWLATLQNLRWDPVLPRGPPVGETVDGFSEFLCRGRASNSFMTGRLGKASWAASVTMFWAAYSSRKCSTQLLALVCNDLSCLGLQQNHLDKSVASGSFDAGVHASCISTVGSRLDPAAHVQPVVIGAVACSLLGLAASSSEGIVGTDTRVLLVGQKCLSLGFRG
ncbi:unnamed protein product [Acanthosepion pharaonis]|uniref:Uncharacterized protein n=1 Tax=Acanthosepion pharaonis TaxID=158019 RepID=A0A812CND6_ACAPH|nr:unnamed protein product [Sepia pharaonis]